MTPKRKGFTLAACGSKGCSACRLHCLRGGIAALAAIGSAIRLVSASIIRCRSAHLLLVRCNRILTIVQILRRAQQSRPRQAEANLHKSLVDGDCVRLTNRRQSDSEDRSKPSRIATPPGRHPIRQAPQLFELLACNVKTFLLGDQKGEVLFCERDPPPLSVPCAAQGTKSVS